MQTSWTSESSKEETQHIEYLQHNQRPETNIPTSLSTFPERQLFVYLLGHELL